MNKILVVEDDDAIRNLIRLNLELNGFSCDCACDGEIASDLLENSRYSLVLLDIMLPKVDGYELLEYTKTLETPVIFLTAKADLNDRIKGLSLGAEDYIVKPFELEELIARINVVLRRYNKIERIIDFLHLRIDTEKQQVTNNGVAIELTPKEYALLLYLVKNHDIVLDRDRIYENVWDSYYDGETRTLELHIQRLRKKAGLNENLKTLYKSGYRLDSNET